MNELANLLRQSLADQRFSGNERSALAEWAASHITTDQQRGVARHTVFETARSAELTASQIIDWIEDVLKVIIPIQSAGPSKTVESLAFFAPGDACLSRITNRINSCRRTADLCIFTITDDRITRAILDAHRHKVHVRIVSDNDKANDLGSDIQRIAEAGVEVRIDNTPYHMHHKFAIFDGVQVINGSYNWTRGAAEQNEENIIDSNDPKLIAAFQDEFDKLWTKFAP